MLFPVLLAGIDPGKGYVSADFCTREERRLISRNEICLRVPARGVTVLRLGGEPVR